eukprot:1158927-Pelagomonas_calceolata.AAC.3
MGTACAPSLALSACKAPVPRPDAATVPPPQPTAQAAAQAAEAAAAAGGAGAGPAAWTTQVPATAGKTVEEGCSSVRRPWGQEVRAVGVPRGADTFTAVHDGLLSDPQAAASAVRAEEQLLAATLGPSSTKPTPKPPAALDSAASVSPVDDLLYTHTSCPGQHALAEAYSPHATAETHCTHAAAEAHSTHAAAEAHSTHAAAEAHSMQAAADSHSTHATAAPCPLLQRLLSEECLGAPQRGRRSDQRGNDLAPCRQSILKKLQFLATLTVRQKPSS